MLRSLFLRAFTRRLIALFAVIALSACGGGGGGGGSGGGFLPDSGGNSAPTPSFSVTVVGKNGQGEDSTRIATSDPLTIEVLVTDSSSNTATAVVGAIVELTSTVGKIIPENASAITDSDGIAGFGIEFDGTEGAGTVTASYTSDGVVYSGTFNVESIVEPAQVPIVSLTLSALNASGDPLTVISQRSPGTIVASLRSEVDGVISSLPGELVTLETNVGRVSPNNRTALTNSEGDAIFTLEFNGAEGAGSVRASATIDNAEYTDVINLQAEDTGPPFELTILTSNTAGTATSTLTSASSLVVEVAVKRIDGPLLVPIGQGETVTLTSSIGKVGGNGSALTNANGIAKFELAFDGTIGAGSLSASYGSESSSVTKISNIQAIAEVIGYTLSVSAESAAGLDSHTFSLDNPLTVTATLSSSSGSTDKKPVTLQTTVGSVSPSNGSTLTDAAGVAKFLVNYNDVIGAGVATVSYMSPNGVVSADINLEAVALQTDRGIVISSYAPDGSASSEFSLGKSLKVEVQLTDATGDPLSMGDELVRLSSTVGRLDADAKLTNAVGVATFDLDSTGAIGAGVLTATYEAGTELLRQQKAVQSVSDTPFSISVSSSGNALSVGQDVALTVTVLDPSEKPVAGGIVAASSSLGRLDRDSALTDASGVALFTLSYDDQLGAGTVTFSYDSGTEVFSNSLAVQARTPVPPTLTILTQVGTTEGATQFDTSSDMSVTVRVSGSSDYSVSAGDTVSLSTTVGTVLGNGAALLVDNGGVLEATFTVSSGDEIGAGTLTASIKVGDAVFESRRNISAVSTNPSYRIRLYQADGVTPLNGSSLSTTSPLIIVATLEDATGLAPFSVGSEIIHLRSTLGRLNQLTALTDTTGDAAFELNSEGVIGAGVVTATYETPEGTVTAQANISVISDSSVSYIVQIKNGSNGWTFSDADKLNLDVTVSASDGSDLVGRLVSLSTDLGIVEGNGSAVLRASSDGDYIASFTVAFADIIGAGTLTASFDVGSETYIARQSIQTTASDAYSLTITPSVATVTVGTPMLLRVGLIDATGDPVVNQSISLTSTIGRLNRDLGVTDASGTTEFVLSSDGVGGDGLVTATYTILGNTYRQTQRVVVAEAVPPTLTILTQVGTTEGATQFDTSSDMSVTVRVSGSSDYSVSAGDTVSLSTTVGTVLGNGAALLVDNGGVLEATFTVSSGDEIGAGTLTASIKVGDETFEKTLSIESLGPPYRLSEVSFKASNGLALTEAVLSSEVPNRTLTASVELTNLAGSPLPNRLIQFATTVGQLTPADGYLLTDVNGRAQIAVEYSDALRSGTGLFTARYVSALGTIEQSADLQALAPDLLLGTIVGTNFTEGQIDSSPASGNLVNQGSGVLRLDIVKGGLDINNASSSDRIKSLQTVAFDSFCLRNGLAALLPSSPVSTSSGELTVTYTAGASCTGEDEVVATLLFGPDTTNQTAQKVFTIAAASEVVSLEFVDLAPSLIAIKGTGELVKISEQTEVRFRVVDVNGSPVQGEIVNLALTSIVGGLSLNSSSATSNAEGLIFVTVSSGTLPAQTVVTAELASTGQLVSSDLITVSTGVPDQNSFTLSASNLSISQAYVVANMTSTIGVAVADRYNNVIPDGSLIYFTTEYGGIDPSCSINDGRCEVTWRSQNPWPTGANLSTVDCSLYDNNGDGIANNDAVGTYDPCPFPLGIEQGSRTTILATATGEESFNDVDGDGLMSDFVNEFSDSAHDLGEPYLDENGNGSYQVGEVFLDDDNDGSHDAGDDFFTGIGCSASTLLSGDCTGSLLSVFDNIELIMSDSDRLYIALVDSDPVPKKVDSVTPGSYVAYISDQYNNRPATGATVLVEATGDCSILTPTSFTVGNSNTLGAFAVGIEIAGVADTPAPDSVSISVTNPGAPKVTNTFSCAP